MFAFDLFFFFFNTSLECVGVDLQTISLGLRLQSGGETFHGCAAGMVLFGIFLFSSARLVFVTAEEHHSGTLQPLRPYPQLH